MRRGSMPKWSSARGNPGSRLLRKVSQEAPLHVFIVAGTSTNGIPAAHCGFNAERDATTPAGETFLSERQLLTLAHKCNFLAQFVNNVNSFSGAFTRQR